MRRAPRPSFARLALLALVAGCSRDDAGSEPRALPGDGPAPLATDTALAAPPAIPDDAPTVAFLGDSIAAGLHLPAEQAFPAVLQQRLAAEGRPFRLVNAGVSGDTTAGGRSRVEWVLENRPDLVVVELGGNDGLRGQPVESVEANLREILRKAKASGAKVLLLGVQLPPNYGAEYVAAFEAMYGRVAREEEVAFVPRFLEGVGGVARLNLEDGLHPTAEGHRKLADNVEPALRELLDELARAATR